MHDVTEHFKELYRDRESNVALKAFVNDVEYDMDELYGASLKRSLLQNNAPEVGGVVSNQLSLTIVPKGPIPRGAAVELYLRVYTPTESSEWILKGTYYIDSRETDPTGQKTTLECMDAMMVGEQEYLKNSSFVTWPQNERYVVNEIASILGVQLDSRTVLSGYFVEYPNDMTCRDVLSYIAASNGGNWTITEDNKLYLVPFVYDFTYNLLSSNSSTAILFGENTLIELLEVAGYPNDKAFDVGRNVTIYQNAGSLDTYTGVNIWYNDEDAFFAGTRDGQVLELDCPWATQQMANNLLTKFSGFVYRAFEVTKASLSPAAELGDLVFVDGNLFPIMTLSVNIDGSYYPDVSAPPDNEVDSEYPYESHALRKQFSRVVKLGSDYYGTTITREHGLEITKTNGQTIKTRVVLNSDTLAFYNDDGSEALYFDPIAGKYKFVGDLEINGGSININSNFIVDQYGNVETNGNVTLDGSNVSINAPLIKGQEIAIECEGSSGIFAMYSTDRYGFRDLWGTMGAEMSASNVPSVFLRYNDYMNPYSPTIAEFVASYSGVRMTHAGMSLFIGEYNGVSGLWFNNNGTYTRIA